MPEHFNDAAALLPRALQRAALALPEAQRARCEELRLRVGRPPSLGLPEGERPLCPEPVTPETLSAVLEAATGASLHAVGEQLRRGFVSAPGGVRVGVCGTAVCERGTLRTLRGVSSLCIRIPRAVPGAGREVLPLLRDRSVLIVSPPGGGKTTFLRELVRVRSDEGRRVALADERGELAAMNGGVPGFDVGRCTDVLSGAPRAEAVMLLLRGMGPEIVAMDELFDADDAAAVLSLLGCGVRVLATAHATDRTELERRPALRRLLQRRAFEKLVTIRGAGDARSYAVETL